MRSERVTFDNHLGCELSARVDLPEGEPRAWALFAHCFTCSKDLRAVTEISRALTSEGCGVLRFDFTGLGRSEGDFADTTFATNQRDLLDAARYMGEHHQAPSLLVGHSLGGTAVLHAASEMPSVRAVATIGSPYRPSHVAHLFGGATDDIREHGEAEVTLAGRSFTIRREFLEALDQADCDEAIAALDAALLVFHSPQDEVVGIDNASRIFTAASHPRSFVSLDDADHLLSRAEDARYVGHVISAWVERYL